MNIPTQIPPAQMPAQIPASQTPAQMPAQIPAAQAPAQILAQQAQTLINQSRTPPALLRIFTLNANPFARNFRRPNDKKYITGLSLLRTKIKEEGLLININNRYVIDESTNRIWKGFTWNERNVFTTYANEIRNR
ncbi:14612_t:CDS:1 [Gigaspora margarita]|uniref:14612_t:CDS:1 n=1 Tax=Gigaspora margarita TaxID=4874 RepID=A0ABM8VYQ3_GIGMA|nr:14612_t:CDS:1 [Gigaspora margarita]